MLLCPLDEIVLLIAFVLKASRRRRRDGRGLADDGELSEAMRTRL
jgi:hypothetical protein